LYVRAYAEDEQGHAAYPDDQKKQISAAPCDAVAAFTASTDLAYAEFDTTGSAGDLSFDYGDGTTGTELRHRYAAAGNYSVTLTATDVANQCTAVKTLFMAITRISGNQAPVADAGPDQTANPGDIVALDGSASHDPDPDDEISYLRTQTDGTLMTLTDPLAVQPYFIADVPGEPLEFSLTVTDRLGFSDDDQVTVNVNQIPVAVALGPDRSLYEGGDGDTGRFRLLGP